MAADALLDATVARLRAILAALEGPRDAAILRWLELARDCEGIDEFFERAALGDEASALAAERTFFAQGGRCPRCGAPRARRFFERERERTPRCERCERPWRRAEHRGARPADWASALAFAARADRVATAERLAQQMNASLRVFGEPAASAFEWEIAEHVEWETLFDLRTGGFESGWKHSSLTRAAVRGRAHSQLNPVLLVDALVGDGATASHPLAIEVARDLVALDGWSRLGPESDECTAFRALDALYGEGVVYQGVTEGRLRLRVFWACSTELARALPR